MTIRDPAPEPPGELSENLEARLEATLNALADTESKLHEETTERQRLAESLQTALSKLTPCTFHVLPSFTQRALEAVWQETDLYGFGAFLIAQNAMLITFRWILL